MAGQQGGKGGGARKIGKKKAQPAQQRYKDRALKKARLVKLMKRFPKYKAPGWKLGEGYGLVETPETRTK